MCACVRVNQCLLSAAGGGAPEPAVGGVQEGRQDGVRVQEGEGEGGLAAEGERCKEVEDWKEGMEELGGGGGGGLEEDEGKKMIHCRRTKGGGGGRGGGERGVRDVE